MKRARAYRAGMTRRLLRRSAPAFVASVLLGAVAWATVHSWAPLLIVGTWASGYAPGPVPKGVAHTVEIERPGAKVRAWVLDPDGVARGTLLLLHGIRDNKKGLLASGRTHRRRGFRAVLVDSRGHGESSGRWLTYGVEESRDLKALVDELAHRGMLTTPLGVIGSSYGAATAIQYAAIDPRLKAVVALASFASLREVVPCYLAWFLGPLASLLPASLARDVVNAAGERAGFDPDAACPRCAAPHIQAPLLLIHSRDDERIPWRHSAKIRDAAKVPVRLFLVSGVRHADVGKAPGVSEAVRDWLDRHLDAS